MPPKTAKKRQQELVLEKAREVKSRRMSGEGTSSTAVIEVQTERGGTDDDTGELTGLLAMPGTALDTDDEAVDPTFDLDSSMKSDTDHIMESFCDDWISHLDKDDRVSLGIFLCFQLTKQLDIGDTKAAELSGIMIGKSDRTVREWRTRFFVNNGEIPESKQGKYQRSGILWTSEDLNST